MNMKIYRTKENNLINLEQVTLIYKDPDDGGYRVSFTSGITYDMPELDETDIERILDYNNYLIQ
jgi:hypothetical protein